MKTNDKTLADVQPGGRVRLGDQGRRCAEHCQNGRADVCLASQRDGVICPDDSCDIDDGIRHNHLSAQPSPGGQDARAIIEEFIQCATLGRPHGKLIAQAKDYLAARQPVGEPITVEAVAEIFNHPEYGLSIDWLLENGIGELQVGDVLMVSDRAITDEDGSGEVYTAMPAQAVDLGPVRELLQRRMAQWRSHLPADPGAPGTREVETKGEHDYNNDVRIYREGIAVMEEVLSKIDSHSAGGQP
ncbi:hypothetical protein [Stenotrophomonas pavanii]|uniref:hypothetical protein n=1 Tax=Stenotrophomonas pavanii TaxID=487698 RepID=UPI003896A9D6